MTELETKYRVAPRQVSPSRLDDVILARAAHKMPLKSRSAWAFSPWKTIAASFCVVGLGVGLLLRYGVPPLDQRSVVTSESFGGNGNLRSDAQTPAAGISQQKEALVIRERDSQSSSLNKRKRADQGSVESISQEESESALMGAKEDAAEPISDSLSADAQLAEIAQPAADLAPAPTVQTLEIAPETERAAAPPLPLEKAQQVAPDIVQPASENGEIIVLTDEMLAGNIDTGASAANRQSQSNAGESNADPGAGAVSSAPSSSLPIPGNLSADRSARQQRSQAPKPGIAERFVADKQTDSLEGSADADADRLPTAAVDWITRQHQSHFTLQLATADDANYLYEFGQSLDLPQDSYVLELSGNPSVTFVKSYGLFYGVFETADKALAHSDTLNENATQFSPWVRRFSRLRSEVVTR